MYASIEARWFYAGTCQKEVAEWFRDTGMAIEEQQRVDRYLVLPETNTLGAKLRGSDRIELKLRVAVLPDLEIGDVQGQCERWHKWSIPVADRGDDDLEADPWVVVLKHRWTRHYEVTDDGEPRPVAPDAQPAEGCKFELTFLKARGSEEWSLAFESFGTEENLMRNFETVTRLILDGGRLPLGLDRERSHGYPEWLRAVRRGAGADQPAGRSSSADSTT